MVMKRDAFRHERGQRSKVLQFKPLMRQCALARLPEATERKLHALISHALGELGLVPSPRPAATPAAHGQLLTGTLAVNS